MPALSDVASEKLQALESAALRRSLIVTDRTEGVYVERDGKRLISFSCNDYLGLSNRLELKRAAHAAMTLYGTGAAASRLVTGNHPLYGELEARLAAWKKTEAALVFGSGYLANIGVITALMGKDDLIIADKLVHACLIDGARLSQAKFLRFAHNNIADCERLLAQHRGTYRHALILTDAIYSMDGNKAPLEALSTVAKNHDAWLLADGAHQLSPLANPVDIYVGTLSKAFGGYGGFVCASKPVIDYLMSSARSFIFSTGLPPATIASSIAALTIMQHEPELLEIPLAKARLFTNALGFPEAESHIVPLILGDEQKALDASALLAEAGFLAAAIRPPAVPAGTARLRFAFSALHTDSDILMLASLIKAKGIV